MNRIIFYLVNKKQYSLITLNGVIFIICSSKIVLQSLASYITSKCYFIECVYTKWRMRLEIKHTSGVYYLYCAFVLFGVDKLLVTLNYQYLTHL